MFLWSFRLSKAKVLLGAVSLVVVAAIGVNVIGGLAQKDSVETAVSAADTTSNKTTEKAKKVTSKKIPAKTEEQRISFAKSFGWEVQEEVAEVIEIVIPKEFDEVYSTYNNMQKKQGYDLEKYTGKRCKRYSYVVTNYPQASGEVRLNILVCDGKVIGGDLCSLEIGGFIHGFAL